MDYTVHDFMYAVRYLLLVPNITRQSKYVASNRPVVYTNIYCDGSESSIADCSKTKYPLSNCYYSYSAGVLCTDGMFKLLI